MILRTVQAAMCGQKVAIRSVDTDVVVLAVANFQFLQLTELWIEFGVGKYYCFIPAHSSIGPEKANVLPFFHALIGCDTTSVFCGVEKMALSVWELSNNLSEISDTFLDKLENFATLMYCVPNQ